MEQIIRYSPAGRSSIVTAVLSFGWAVRVPSISVGRSSRSSSSCLTTSTLWVNRPTLVAMMRSRPALTRTFWGSVGGLTQFQFAQFLIDGLTIVSVAGIVIWAFRRGPSLRPAIVLASYPVILIALHMQSGWGGYVRNTIVAGTQGR